jgi:hypothetical protein
VIGFFSFTEVTAGPQTAGSGAGAGAAAGAGAPQHHAYNEWHQLDHLPQQFALEGVRFGQRWVRTPECRAAEFTPSDATANAALDRCHYMTLYLLHDESVLPQFAALADQLRREGRFFEARERHLSGSFRMEGQWAAPRVKVSADVIPFRPSEGIYVVVGPKVDGGEMLASHEGVAGVWTFGGKGRCIAVAFIDGDLLATAAGLSQALGNGAFTPTNATPTEWAGPLQRIDANQWSWFDRLTPQ